MDSNTELKKRKKPAKKVTCDQNGNKVSEIFMCYCGKSYYSFPALYLHNKTKHTVLLRVKQKEQMTKRKLWSGKKKKIIYQFPQDSEDEEEISSDYLEEKEDERRRQQARRKKGTVKKEQKESGKITIDEALQLLVHDALFYFKEFQFEWIKLISFEIKQCFNHYYRQIFVGSENFNNFCEENSPQKIPDGLNFFATQYLASKRSKKLQFGKKMTSFLIKLSTWLHEKDFAQNIIVLNDDYMVKPEQK